MANLREWLECKAGGEKIEGVVIGEAGWGCEEKENIPKNKLLSWEEAKKYLDYNFHDGYGSPECHAITAWTPTKVMFIVEYDGATDIKSVPRHPQAHEPEMVG